MAMGYPASLLGGKVVVFTGAASGNGLPGDATAAAHGAARAGVVVLTMCIATHYCRRGIRCNTIVPGWTIANY